MPVRCCAVERIRSFAVLFLYRGIRPSTGGMNAYGKTTEGQSPGPMIGRWACDTTHRGRCRRHCCVSVRNAAQRITIPLALKALPDGEHCLHLFVFFLRGYTLTVVTTIPPPPTMCKVPVTSGTSCTARHRGATAAKSAERAPPLLQRTEDVRPRGKRITLVISSLNSEVLMIRCITTSCRPGTRGIMLAHKV